LFKADIQAGLADAKSLGNCPHPYGLPQMQCDILPGHGDDLHPAATGFWRNLRSLLSKAACHQGQNAQCRNLIIITT